MKLWAVASGPYLGPVEGLDLIQPLQKLSALKGLSIGALLSELAAVWGLQAAFGITGDSRPWNGVPIDPQYDIESLGDVYNLHGGRYKGVCDDVTPFVESVYQQILADASAATRKAADKSYFSLADGVIQARTAARPPPPLAASARAE